jgi:16S rRNA processing protein RimM
VPESRILMGVIGRPHGVRGLVRVTSYADDLTAYGPLSDAQGRRYVLHSRGEGVAEIAEVVGGAEVKVADRAAAEKLTNTRLYVDRAQLPEPEDGEFYLADLIGLAAVDVGGMVLGTVGAVHDYGAGASLEIVCGERPPLLVPFTRASVPTVDLAAQRVVVEPPEDRELLQDTSRLSAGGGWGEGAELASPPPPSPLPQGEGEKGCA